MLEPTCLISLKAISFGPRVEGFEQIQDRVSVVSSSQTSVPTTHQQGIISRQIVPSYPKRRSYKGRAPITLPNVYCYLQFITYEK